MFVETTFVRTMFVDPLTTTSGMPFARSECAVIDVVGRSDNVCHVTERSCHRDAQGRE